jgi:hypothetical protein
MRFRLIKKLWATYGPAELHIYMRQGARGLKLVEVIKGGGK